MASVYNLELEKQFLSAAILHPSVLALCPRITVGDFSETNRMVFSALRAAVAACQEVESEFTPFLLIDRLNSLGLKIGGAMEPALYIKSLEGLAVSESAGVAIGRRLYQTTVRRKLHLTGIEIARKTEKDDQKRAVELVAEITGLFNREINILSGSDEDEPEDLFDVDPYLDEENEYETRSLLSPFPLYNDLYGSFDPGNLYIFASRMKVGKSTFWLSMLRQLAEQDKDDTLRVLVLDTELTTRENQSRALSSKSGVKEYFVRHKLYRKNPEMLAKVEAAASMRSLKGKVAHKYVGGRELDEILAIARRWAAKCLREGKRGLIVFDYFKLNSSADFKSDKLFMTMGGKVDAFKNLSKDLNLPIVCFVQTNRENEESKSGGKMVNSSVIGGSDMIAQFGSNIYLLDKLSPDERKRLAPDDAVRFTHRLLPIATRQLGPDIMGKNRLVRYRDEGQRKDRFCENHILLNFDNFNVTEATTFYDLMEKYRTRGIEVQAAEPDQGPETGGLL